jgi:hypothetical protein
MGTASVPKFVFGICFHQTLRQAWMFDPGCFVLHTTCCRMLHKTAGVKISSLAHGLNAKFETFDVPVLGDMGKISTHMRHVYQTNLFWEHVRHQSSGIWGDTRIRDDKSRKNNEITNVEPQGSTVTKTRHANSKQTIMISKCLDLR